MYLYFDAVAREGSIRKAATQLYVASSALSRAVLELEEQVGSPLFERLSGGVRLTPAGEVFHEHVLQTLEKLQAACLRIDDLGGLVHGIVRLMATETMALNALPESIAKFRSLHPGVSFELTMASGDVSVGALLSDQVDLIVSFNPHLVPGMQVHRSVTQQMCAVMRADHPLARKEKVSIEECVAYPLAIPAVGMGGRTLLDELFTQLSIKVEPALVANSLEALKSFARHSDGISFQLSMGVNRNKNFIDLRAIALSDRVDSSKIVIASRKGRVLSHAGTAFLEHLKAELTM